MADRPALPIEAYERAAINAGFRKNPAGRWEDPAVGEDGVTDVRQLCEMEGIDVWTMCLPPLARRDMERIRDPRRTVVMCHRNSSSSRAKRWYRIAEACEFDGSLWLHRDHVKDDVGHMHECSGATPRTRADAVKMAKAHAEETGHPFVAGVFEGFAGRPLTKI